MLTNMEMEPKQLATSYAFSGQPDIRSSHQSCYTTYYDQSQSQSISINPDRNNNQHHQQSYSHQANLSHTSGGCLANGRPETIGHNHPPSNQQQQSDDAAQLRWAPSTEHQLDAPAAPGTSSSLNFAVSASYNDHNQTSTNLPEQQQQHPSSNSFAEFQMNPMSSRGDQFYSNSSDYCYHSLQGRATWQPQTVSTGTGSVSAEIGPYNYGYYDSNHHYQASTNERHGQQESTKSYTYHYHHHNYEHQDKSQAPYTMEAKMVDSAQPLGVQVTSSAPEMANSIISYDPETWHNIYGNDHLCQPSAGLSAQVSRVVDSNGSLFEPENHCPDNPTSRWQPGGAQPNREHDKSLMAGVQQQLALPTEGASDCRIVGNQLKTLDVDELATGGELATSRATLESRQLINLASMRRRNQCHVCGRNYARPSTLKTHLRTHTNERPFKCNVCLKTFSQAANLTAHQRVHTGERPFSCPICGRQFSQSSSVITHLRTHSGERPYRCINCERTFSDSSTLTKHCRIHSGEKPYQCEYCPLNFSQSGNLSRHLKLHLISTTNGLSTSSSSSSSTANSSKATTNHGSSSSRSASSSSSSSLSSCSSNEAFRDQSVVYNKSR